MINDTIDYFRTMDTLGVTTASIVTVKDDAYGAALGLIYWSDLSTFGRHGWRRAALQNTQMPQAGGFFGRLRQLERLLRTGLTRYDYPWSLTDPDFMFCRHYITAGGNVNAGHFQERYLKNLSPIDPDAVEEKLKMNTTTFLRSGTTNEKVLKLPALMYYEKRDPESMNLLSKDVDWEKVKGYLDRQLQLGPDADRLLERYETDKGRREYLARKGLAYMPIISRPS